MRKPKLSGTSINKTSRVIAVRLTHTARKEWERRARAAKCKGLSTYLRWHLETMVGTVDRIKRRTA